MVATDTTLHLHVVDDYTLSLTSLTDLMLFTRIFDVAAVSSPIPGRDVLVILTDASNISFMQFDEASSRLRCSGAVSVIPPASFPSEATIRRQARLLATHPRKRMVAVASLQSVISVFPILFLPKQVNAGKIATVAVDGVILSLDFLEDEEGVPGDAILIALLQKGKEQVIALYTVGVPDLGGGLSVTFVGSMITCASHPDDVAVARATSKLTGESIRPTPPATAVTRLSGCPFLFAVFVRGRIIAGDARSVIVNAHSGESLPMSVRIEHDIILPSAVSQEHTMEDTSSFEDPSSSQPANFQQTMPGSSFLTPSSSGVGFDSQDGFVTPTETPTNRALGDPPAVTMPSRRARRGGRDDIPPLPSLSRRLISSRSPYTGQGERNLGEDLLSYLFVPAYISLDVGESNGVTTAWVDARDHFCDENGDGNGLYFVMESGAMFVLRWSDSVREGTTTFRIPGGERTRTTPKRNFSVEFIGDVGPAISITSLDRRLLYIANDCADGSLRQLHIPQNTSKRRCRPSLVNSSDARPFRAQSLRYGLEVRQEFLNLAPISDFVLVPPKLHQRAQKIGQESSNTSDGRKVELHSALKTFSETEILRIDDKKASGLQSAFDHVIYGGTRETEIIACSGMGQYGCIRLIRPGAPVSLLASSDAVFTACNEIWSLRLSHDSEYDAGLVLTFAMTTTVLLAVPPSTRQEDENIPADSNGLIAKLIDGTRAIGLVPDCRTIAINIIEDGVIAQVHEQGVRLSFLEKEKNLELSECVIDGVLIEPFYRRLQDWNPPEGGIVSMAAVGHGYVIVSVICGRGLKPTLFVLRCVSSSNGNGLEMVASMELDQEISCMEIPNWPSLLHEPGVASRRIFPEVLIGTYAPSLEIRSLDASLRLLGKKELSPWSETMLNDYPSDISRRQGQASRNTSDSRAHRGVLQKDVGRPTRTDRARARSDHMTAVPESICSRIVDGRRKVLVGLRDGSVVCLSVSKRDSPRETERRSRDVSAYVSFEAHRKLGHRPVTLRAITASMGAAFLAQAERSWMGISSGRGKLEWTPLAFPETRSVCSFSVRGAERCFAAVASDDALYICALRHKRSVSVSSFLLGATPRRVLAISSPQDCIVVATCRDPRSSLQKPEHASASDDVLAADSSARGIIWHSEVRTYDRRNRVKLGTLTLLPGELVHVLVNWLGFLVVGTSWGIQEANAQRTCNRGRLLLYSLRHSQRRKGTASTANPRIKFSLCSEVVLPGAILAGAPHPSADIFVASCNAEVIVFAVPKSRTALFEIARVSARTLVVSISLKDDIVCVVDRKDSASFFQLHCNSGRLVRDRSDHRRRILSDAVLVDRTLAVTVDRLGGLLSVGYEDGDRPAEVAIVWPDGSVMSPYLRNSSDLTISDSRPSGASTGEDQPATGLSTLGEEFDMVHLDSGSDQSIGSHEGVHQSMGVSGETNSATSPDVSEQDNAGISEDTGNSGVFGDGNAGSEDSMDGAGEQGGETDEANPAQSADDGIMIAVDEDGDEEGVDGEVGVHAAESHLDARQAGMPRNLVCHHSFNLNDTALRVRSGEFVRSECKLETGALRRELGSASTRAHEKFIGEENTGVFCGTLGGALVVAVPMSGDAYELLSEVERELGENTDIIGTVAGSSHKAFRSVYGDESLCCVDGDVLKLYSQLDQHTKREIASLVGCRGENGVFRIEGMIDELFDRVG